MRKELEQFRMDSFLNSAQTISQTTKSNNILNTLMVENKLMEAARGSGGQ